MRVDRAARMYRESDDWDESRDALTAHRVSGALEAEELLRGARIEVLVRDGVVLLGGEVFNEMQRKQAEAVASGVAHVTGVQNELRIIGPGIGTTAI